MTVPPLGGSAALQRWAQNLQAEMMAESRPAVSASAIETFSVTAASTTDGAQVNFTLASVSGIGTVLLLRGFSADPGSAKVLQSYAPAALRSRGQMTYADADPALAGQTAYYWLELVPLNDALPPTTVGPQTLAAAQADLIAPDSLISFDASESVASGGVVTIGVSFQPPNETRFGSCKVYIAGYQGNSSDVAIAQAQADPMSFTLEPTGEVVTLKAVSVNKAGAEAAIGTALTKQLTLNGTATVPAQCVSVTATALTTGVQIDFPSGPESSITQYVVSRANLGAGFAASSQVGTVNPTGAGAYTFLDTGGLAGSFEWYVQAKNSVGLSKASAAASTAAVTSSANLPSNVPQNTTNYATVDSVDAGTSATIRIYGPGGVGTSWNRPTGYGTQTMAAGTLTGLSYNTAYYVLWNGNAYFATTSYPNALGDSLIWAGKVTTVAAGGAGGTSGGGGVTNFQGGHLAP